MGGEGAPGAGGPAVEKVESPDKKARHTLSSIGSSGMRLRDYGDELKKYPDLFSLDKAELDAIEKLVQEADDRLQKMWLAKEGKSASS